MLFSVALFRLSFRLSSLPHQPAYIHIKPSTAPHNFDPLQWAHPKIQAPSPSSLSTTAPTTRPRTTPTTADHHTPPCRVRRPAVARAADTPTPAKARATTLPNPRKSVTQNPVRAHHPCCPGNLMLTRPSLQRTTRTRPSLASTRGTGPSRCTTTRPAPLREARLTRHTDELKSSNCSFDMYHFSINLI